MARDRLIPVHPRNYRSIALHAISAVTNPVVIWDRKRIVAFLLLMSYLRLGCATEPPAQTSSDNDYYAMERACKGNSCCLASMHTMKARQGFRIKNMNDTCPANYRQNMLRCIDTYVWCEPTKIQTLK